MFVQSSKRKFGTTRGSPRRSRTAKALGISRTAAKSERACEWDGWGRLSDDGLGQNNPNRSEDPWGAGCPRPDFAVSVGPPFPDSELEVNGWSADTKDGDKLDVDIAYAGSELKRLVPRKVPSDTHTFQPYWGKPAVRNDRGDRGNVGIIRSPVRATILLACGGRSAMTVPTAIDIAYNKDNCPFDGSSSETRWIHSGPSYFAELTIGETL
jgi:hypothetical protein